MTRRHVTRRRPPARMTTLALVAGVLAACSTAPTMIIPASSVTVSCQPFGYAPAPVTLQLPGGVLDAKVAEAIAVSMVRTCAATPDENGTTTRIDTLGHSVGDGTGNPTGPNAGQPVWTVKIDTTESVGGGEGWNAHYWIEVNKATGVPTLIAYG